LAEGSSSTTETETETATTDSDGSTTTGTDPGVTRRTTKRRAQATRRFSKFCAKRNIHTPSAEDAHRCIIRQYKNPRTRLSTFVTLAAELRRKNNPLTGDTQGYVRLLKLAAIASPPKRSPIIAVAELTKRISACKNQEIQAMIALTFAFGARLTSIHSIRRAEIEAHQYNNSFATIRVTFRKGKTILSTGPYTQTALIPTMVANWISTQRTAMVFNKNIEHYYKEIGKILHPFHIRSLRRTAAQILAQKFLPEQIIQVTRHTTTKGLAAYLDDGMRAEWQHAAILPLAAALWQTP
jgi:hypothetical protein